MKLLFILLIFNTLLLGDKTFSQMYNEPVDASHKYISDNVIKLSDYLDESINKLFKQKELQEDASPHNKLEDKIQQIDTFFKGKKYLDGTNDTYAKIYTDYLFESKTKESANIKIRAKIPLRQSRKNFKLFINDFDDADSNNSTPAVGVDYIAEQTYSINSRYSIGARGFYPYLKARYNIAFEAGIWIIEPVQTFKYSIKTHFEEETSVYFDTKFKKKTLFRLHVQRKIQQDKEGMDYSFHLSLLTIRKNKLGFNFIQSFYGNTKYDNLNTSNIESFPGINNYMTSVSFRRSVWKKWLFYEITPAVNFHRQYDYQANYSVRFSVDLYFGRFEG